MLIQKVNAHSFHNFLMLGRILDDAKTIEIHDDKKPLSKLHPLLLNNRNTTCTRNMNYKNSISPQPLCSMMFNSHNIVKFKRLEILHAKTCIY